MSSNSPDIQRGLQILTAGLSVASIGGLVYWIKRNRDRWYYAIPPLFWIMHVLVFLVNRLAEKSGYVIILHPEFDWWFTLLLLHAVATIAGIVTAFLFNWIRPYRKLL